jgi:flagellar M-ring protein FliF
VVETLAKSPGGISKLTVSVMLDGRDSTVVDPKGKSKVIKIPWTTQQLASIRTISENAIGFSPERGDRVDIEYMEFSGGEEGKGSRMAVKDTIVEAVRAFSTGLVILAALGILFLIIRSITRTLDPTRIKFPSEADFEKKKAELIKVEEEVNETEKSVLVRKIVSKAIKDPEMIAKSIKTFYREDTTR